MASAADAFAHAFIAAFVRCTFIILHGFIRICFRFAMTVAVMPFSGFGRFGF